MDVRSEIRERLRPTYAARFHRRKRGLDAEYWSLLALYDAEGYATEMTAGIVDPAAIEAAYRRAMDFALTDVYVPGPV
jgi:hypothetical protein